MSAPSSTSTRVPLWPVGLLAGLTLAVWLACARWPGLLLAVGIHDYRTSYLDSYAVLAALDAVRAGVDPHGTNPLDPLMRGHVYSDWWLALRWLGLTRENNFLVGTFCAGAFGVTAWLTARPRRLGEALGLAALLVSPPVMLAVMRANNDLVIFVLLAGCGAAATAQTWWRYLAPIACLAVATGLKYFPAPGVLAFLWVRPVRRMPGILLAGMLGVGMALASVWTQIERSRFVVVSTVHTMGAPLWWRELGWVDARSAVPGLLLIVVAAVGLALGRITTGLMHQGQPAERLRAALGAIVLLTCFVSGVNYGYRWIFVIWPAFWLWQRAIDGSLAPVRRGVARGGCALVLLSVWQDGILCLIVNRFMPLMSKPQVNELESLWRLWTQPVHWLLMMLLAGWLLEGALAAGREWWDERHAS